MKVITCAPLPPPHGGIANWYAVLCAEAAKKNHVFLNIDTSPRKSIDGRSIFYRIFVQGFRMLGQRQEMKRLINENKDICAAHLTTSGQFGLVRDIILLSLLKKKKVRSVYHIHFGAVPEMFQSMGLGYKLFCKAASMADEIIAIDPTTFEVLKESFGEKLHYIPNPVDPAAEKLGDSKRALFLGNVLSTKGVEELLAAWSKISESHPDWNLTIAGFCEKDYKEYLEKNYSMNQVEILGFVEHSRAMELLAESAFLVLPSYTEGFPNVVLEAMMRRKAVVATDVGAIADILSSDCGLVINPQSAEDIEEAMNKLINDTELCKALGENGYKKASAQYVTSVVVDQYERLWKGND